MHYLCYARIAQQDAIGSLELLLASGADPNAHYISWGAPFTAITGAVGQGEQGPIRLPSHPDALQLVTRLLDAGASPNDAQTLYNTMLGADTVWLRLFLSRGLTAEDPITWPIEGGARSLDFVLANAVDHGDMERVELLLGHGANPDCINTYGGLPIHTCALLGGHDAVAERLVEVGAALTVLDSAQSFARAIAMRDLEAARVTMSPEILANPQHLLGACNRGEVETIRFLLDAGANVNGVDDHGVSPLHRAAWNDQSEVVRMLLSRGADPTLREKNYNATPHEWAVHNESAVAAGLLSGN
jgi:ankyrin repeat protein